MRVLLVFPPQWTAAQPYFGLSALNGQLRAAGHHVSIRDLNLEFMEHVLSEETQRQTVRRLDEEMRRLELELAQAEKTGDGDAYAFARARLDGMERYVKRAGGTFEFICANAGSVPDLLRRKDVYYSPDAHTQAMRLFDAALELYSVPSFPSSIRASDFRHPTCSYDLAPILSFTEDARLNPFVDYFRAQLPSLLADGAGVIALSVASFSQVLPALTLARQLKRAAGAQGPRILLGGNFFSRLEDQLQKKPEFFAHFADAVAIGEGERTMVELCQVLDGGHGLERLALVPNLVFAPAPDRVVLTPKQPNYAMADQAFQALDGFPLDRYFAPERVVCVRTSKTCYWSQCSFCDCYYGLEKDAVGVQQVVGEMRHLRDRFGVRHFEFVDQCLTPKVLSALSDALLEADLGVHWFFNGRTELGFTEAILEKARRAGATMIMWGVETGSARILKAMKKGVPFERRMEVLKRSTDAGLFNFAYVFFGFPTETHEEAQMTIDLIRNNTDVIHGYGRSVFTLGKHAPLMQEAERHGIVDVVEEQQDLSTNLTYKVTEGLQPEELMRVSARCHEQCRQAYGERPLWMALRAREALHLFLAHHGRDYVRSFQFDDPAAAASKEFVF